MYNLASCTSARSPFGRLVGLSLLLMCSGCVRAGYAGPDARLGDGPTQDPRADAGPDATSGFFAATLHNAEWSSGHLQLKRWTVTERELPHNAGVTDYFDARNNVLLLHLNGTKALADRFGVVPDYSGGDHPATAHDSDNSGLSFVAGQLRQAVQFDGVDDRLEIVDHDDLDLVDTPWTVALWVKVDAFSDKADVLLVDHGGLSTTHDAGWTFGVTHMGHFLLAVNGTAIRSRTEPVQPGPWRHLVATFDRGSGVFYVNGVPVEDYQGLPATVGRAETPVSIGENLAGRLDEVALWQRVLTDDEITSLYRRQHGDFARGQPGTATSSTIPLAADASPVLLAWTPAAPYGKELPADGVSEVAYGEGNASMVDIVGLWRFNGPYGSIANGMTLEDVSGQGNHGKAVNADGEGLRFAPGRFAGAVCLDGVDDYLELPSDLTAGLTDFTFSAWVLWHGPIRANTLEWQRLFDFGDGPATSSSGRYLYMAPATGRLGDTDRPLFSASLAGFQSSNAVTSGRVLLPGAWRHVAITLDGEVASLYLDGALQGRNSDFPLTPVDVAATEHWLGRSHYDADAPLWACLDETALWGRALSAQEVLGLYRRGVLQVGVQLRFCAEPQSCATQLFVGPAGTPDDFFDELGNTTNGLPRFTLPDTPAGKFAQYRLVLRSFDARISPHVVDLTLGGSGR